VLLVGTNTGFWAKPAEAAPLRDTATVHYIDNKIKPQPTPSWDELIKPQLIKAEEDRKAEETARQVAAVEAEHARLEAVRIEQERLARLPKPVGTFANSYDWGNCTWYVASRKQVPGNWGNAATWFGNAQAQGWATGSVPQVGAIAQTTAGWAGHVALVEAVEGPLVLVSEMNYEGLDVIDQRWASANDFNYIY
jgi:hypothetical protein